MFRKALTSLVVLIILLGPGIGAATPAKAAACTDEQGQLLIEMGLYKQAIKEFTCVIEAQPTEVEGYRGRIEAELLLGLYSDAVRDYARVTAFVIPVHPDAESLILNGYAARLDENAMDIPALMGASFAHWYFFNYAQALQLVKQILTINPDDLYGNLFRGSNRLLLGPNPNDGIADLERALSIAPQSPDVHYVVSDAYFYGRSDYLRAIDEAMQALNGGLDTPRVRAILAGAYLALGDLLTSADHFKQHMDLVTNELVSTTPLAANTSMVVDLVPGRTYKIPVPANAGETLWITTSSHDFYDTIIVLLAPDGTPVVGSDDFRYYFAGFKWDAEVTGTYMLLATSFEGINTGGLNVTRK